MTDFFLNDGKGIDAAVNEITHKYSILQERISSLSKENERLKSEHYKDDEIAKLKSDNDRLRSDLIREFGVTEGQEKKISAWMDNHECRYSGTRLHGIQDYRFAIISGIGYNGYVTCNCGKEFCFYEE